MRRSLNTDLRRGIHMERSSVRTVRIPLHIAGAVERRAAECSVTFNDIVVRALQRFLRLPRHPRTELMERLSAWVARSFDPADFGEDVTLQVVRHLRANLPLRLLYQEAVSDARGRRDGRAKAGLHRRIGKMVKNVLGAVVAGRSGPLDPEVELIGSYSLLRPRRRERS
jgi:hypothetical protein